MVLVGVSAEAQAQLTSQQPSQPPADASIVSPRYMRSSEDRGAKEGAGASEVVPKVLCLLPGRASHRPAMRVRIASCSRLETAETECQLEFRADDSINWKR